MDTLQSIVLGIIQGITEFLPVSSSAHLIIGPYFLHWEDPGLAFDVALHMGTLAAILLFFWRDWLDILKQLSGGKSGVPLKLLVVGTVPAAIVGYMLEKYAEDTFRSPTIIAGTLAAFGALLWYYDRNGRKDREISVFTVKDAAIVGLAQALAVVPGVSRSGITITAALALGLTRPAAARFSFLLSAPIIAGAGILKSKHIYHTLMAGGPDAAAVGWGFFASLLSGLLAVGFLSYMIRSRTYAVFSIYRIVLGAGVVAAMLLR